MEASNQIGHETLVIPPGVWSQSRSWLTFSLRMAFPLPASAAFPEETEVWGGAPLSECFGLPAVNVENGSLAIAGPVRRQECHHSGNFRRLAKTPHAELFGHP